MKLTNKYIAEGMYVINGKQVWKVIDWDSKYRNVLLREIDKNGNKTDYFVVANGYELYGDENEALISWMNGDYIDDVSQSDAEEYFDDFYKNGKIKESLTESAKPINEKNVAKFVDELNKFCDEKIHYVDADAERFTKKYGKMYNFKYRFDDTDEIFVVYDSEGTLDMFDDDVGFVREEIDRLAKKNDWYADPYTSSNNFTFGEI